MTSHQIVVRDRVTVGDNKKVVVNQQETRLAREKARKMKEAFSTWFWSDMQRREKYVERYNRLFNSIRGREYDGSHQTFVGMDPAIELRPHRKNAVLREKLGGNRDWILSLNSKVNKLCDNLEKIYRDTEKEKGVQIVFRNIAIHEDKEHFSVYNAVRDELLKRGIPREEICFAEEAKTDPAKSDMYAQLRKGEKRIILASTAKLGTGANIQNRIAAIHHLDIPWKPSDLEQQNGRGLRQGNMFKEVGIYHSKLNSYHR